MSEGSAEAPLAVLVEARGEAEAWAIHAALSEAEFESHVQTLGTAPLTAHLRPVKVRIPVLVRRGDLDRARALLAAVNAEAEAERAAEAASAAREAPFRPRRVPPLALVAALAGLCLLGGSLVVGLVLALRG